MAKHVPKKKTVYRVTGRSWTVKQSVEHIPNARESFDKCEEKFLIKIRDDKAQEFWMALAKDYKWDRFRYIRWAPNTKFGEMPLGDYFKYLEEEPMPEAKMSELMDDFNSKNEYIILTL